ncbi:MAG: VPLPA-CTERM sorting domain-containing protein [Gammaproteobacteria bacterium]|nr:VPLPA-CTERM sorting domain-containing protein [Gammaproteobacteria bacterium]
MKDIKKLASSLVAALSLLTAGSAAATTVTHYSDVYNAGEITLSTSGTNNDSWIFNITTDGFNPVSQDVSSATIILEWEEDEDDDKSHDTDNDGEDDEPEEHKSGTVTLANLTVGTENFSSVTSETAITVGLTSIITLSATGELSATLEVTSGEIEFKKATLDASAIEATVTPPTAVPIPAAMWLFGSGLIGLFAIARRRK